MASLFNINIYDPATETTKLTNVISVEDELKDTDSLSTIRAHLVKDKMLDLDKASLAFCTPKGARIVDRTKFSIYKTLVKDSGTEETAGGMKTYNVYLESPAAKDKKELSEQAKELLKKELDMDLVKNKPELIAATLKELTSSYKHDNFKAASAGVVVTGASMSEVDWSTVLRNTHFLNGQRIVFSKNANGTQSFQRIDRAPFTAFTLKPRNIDGLVTDKSISIQEKYRIPRYVTTDDSYVNVFETASALSESLAASSFSQTDIEASAGGGLFGASLSVKAGFSKSQSSAVASSSSSSTRSMNITYNFPRVVLHLDAQDLELTPQFQKALDGVKDPDSLVKFHQDYGHFFARNVQLGGRLFASEQFSSTDQASKVKTANAMKASASASFSYGAFQASASYSRETQEASEQSSQKSQMTSSLSWEAQGGDTILCNDPPNWCPTVKPCQNWRIINQKDVMTMGDFLGTFEGYNDIPRKFEKIMTATKKLVTCEFRLRAIDKESVKDEYYGFRKDKEEKRLKSVLDQYEEELKKKVKGDSDKSKEVDDKMKKLKKRVQEDWFTVNYEEHVGINKYDAGCIFEVEVETTLNQAPQLQLNQPYLIYNKHFNSYLAADTSGTYEDRFFGYLFYARRDRANKWVFMQKGGRVKDGVIPDGMELELALLDDDNQPIAVVQRFTGDQCTLLVSKLGKDDSLTTSHNATIEYLNKKR